MTMMKFASLLAAAALAVSVLPAGAQTETEDALPELSCETAPGEAALWGTHRVEVLSDRYGDVSVSVADVNAWKKAKRIGRLRNAPRDRELGAYIRDWTWALGRTDEARNWRPAAYIPEGDPRWRDCVVRAKANLFGTEQVFWVGIISGPVPEGRR